MPRNPAPPPAAAGHNVASFDKDQLLLVEKLTKEIQGLEDDRSAINDSISQRRSEIKALGINMDAWRSAKRRKEMDPDDRAEFDKSQALVNAALGIPVQADLFDTRTTTELPSIN